MGENLYNLKQANFLCFFIWCCPKKRFCSKDAELMKTYMEHNQNEEQSWIL